MKKRIVYMVSTFLFAACGSRHAEQAHEKERIELETRAQREMEAANKAITEMNQKMFRKRSENKSTNAPGGNVQDSSKQER